MPAQPSRMVRFSDLTCASMNGIAIGAMGDIHRIRNCASLPTLSVVSILAIGEFG